MTDRSPALEAVAREQKLPREASTSQFVRFAALAVICLNMVLAAVELGRLALAPASAGLAWLALLATACALPLHVRHVVYGLRGIRPPHGYWTLAALAAVNIAAAAVIGQVWLMNFALLAVSALIVLPAARAMLAFALIVLSTGPLAGPPNEFSGAYLIFSVGWRSITLFVLLWLVAAYRQLDAARREFRDRAVVRDRLRIQAELRRGLGRALECIVAGSCRASALADADPNSAANELKLLVEESRRALADARRLIAGYQRASIRAELDAALAPIKDPEALKRLLEAAPHTPRPELERQVQGVLQQNTYCADDGRLADIDRKLSLVRVITPIGLAHLERIRAKVTILIGQVHTDAWSAENRADTKEQMQASESDGVPFVETAPRQATKTRRHRTARPVSA